MKTEKQTLERLEEIVTSLNKFVDELPEGLSTKESLSAENQSTLSTLVGGLAALAWVLDAEAEIASFVRIMKLQAVAEKLTGSSEPSQASELGTEKEDNAK